MFGIRNYQFFISKAWFCFILLCFFNDFEVKFHETLRIQWFGMKNYKFYQFYKFYRFYNFFKTLLTDLRWPRNHLVRSWGHASISFHELTWGAEPTRSRAQLSSRADVSCQASSRPLRKRSSPDLRTDPSGVFWKSGKIGKIGKICKTGNFWCQTIVCVTFREFWPQKY